MWKHSRTVGILKREDGATSVVSIAVASLSTSSNAESKSSVHVSNVLSSTSGASCSFLYISGFSNIDLTNLKIDRSKSTSSSCRAMTNFLKLKSFKKDKAQKGEQAKRTPPLPIVQGFRRRDENWKWDEYVTRSHNRESDVFIWCRSMFLWAVCSLLWAVCSLLWIWFIGMRCLTSCFS